MQANFEGVTPVNFVQSVSDSSGVLTQKVYDRSLQLEWHVYYARFLVK